MDTLHLCCVHRPILLFPPGLGQGQCGLSAIFPPLLSGYQQDFVPFCCLSTGLRFLKALAECPVFISREWVFVILPKYKRGMLATPPLPEPNSFCCFGPSAVLPCPPN